MKESFIVDNLSLNVFTNLMWGMTSSNSSLSKSASSDSPILLSAIELPRKLLNFGWANESSLNGVIWSIYYWIS